MQAVRLARYHTRRRYLVRFCGAYHGWWGDVQPGVGNPLRRRGHLHAEGHGCGDAAGAAHAARHRLRAGESRAGDAPQCRARRRTRALIDSGRSAHFDRAAYAAWLTRAARGVHRARDIVLIFDEVFVGFRLAPGGAQEYFGVRADMVTYGKTLGGGLPIGVGLRPPRSDEALPTRSGPADVCLARGTFNAHPYVMGAMHEFLTRLESEPIRARYRDLDAVWERRARELNERLRAARAAGSGRASVIHLDRQLPRSLRATTGCSSTTCARRDWP